MAGGFLVSFARKARSVILCATSTLAPQHNLKDVHGSLRQGGLFVVKVDPTTGEWLTGPTPTGRVSTATDWIRRESTSETGHTIYSPDDSKEVRALILDDT